jgi:hypothetical protein
VLNIYIDPRDIKLLLDEVKLKSTGIKSISTPRNAESMAKAIFTIAGNDFIKKTNRYAATNKRSLHHVYEWNKVGNDSSRLFKLVRNGVSNGRLTIGYKFIDSKTAVPIHPDLTRSGKGKRKVSKKYTFTKKAQVMESGNPVRITAKTAKFLVFPSSSGKNGLAFAKSTTVRHPGGKFVAGSFEKRMWNWFGKTQGIYSAISASGYMTALEKEIGICLSVKRASASDVNASIKMISDKYSKGAMEL